MQGAILPPAEGESDRDRLVRIETKLDAYLPVQQDHELRIRALEKARWIIAGVAAAGGGAAGGVISSLFGA